MAGLIFASLLMMIFGYQMAEFVPVYDTPSWTVYVNNLMMIGAVVLFGMSGSKGRLGSMLRHPMLLGFLVWALAHLLANGDLASVLLFGGLAGWAIVSILLINAQDGPWERPEPSDPRGDMKLAIISVVVFIVISLLHGWLGPSPFGG